MLTQTSETAIRALILVSLSDGDRLLTPRQIADTLDTSPTYMAKITGLLVKANILRSQRGATGGVMLARDPKTITLLAVVEACQGLLVGNYCDEIGSHPEPVCAFHTAMKEAHTALVSVLTKWNLQDMIDHPGPVDSKDSHCKMGFCCTDGKITCTGRDAEGNPAEHLITQKNGNS